jgi:hypothetical protein
MGRRVKFKARGQKTDMEEVFAIALHQKRHDAAGNRVVGYDFEQIMALRPAERERLKQTGWLGKGKSAAKRR